MNFLIGFSVVLLVSGCASMNVKKLPMNERVTSYQIPSTLKTDDLFDRVQKWTAVGGGQIRLSDRKAGNVVLRANVECDAVEMGNGYAKDGRVWFVLDIQVKPTEVSMRFSDVNMTSIKGWDSDMRPSTAAELTAINEQCLSPLKASLQAAIN